MAWSDRSKKFRRVEERRDFIEPPNPERTLDRLETGSDDCALKEALSPKFIHQRMMWYYDEFPSLSHDDAKLVISKVWNLSRPILHQVVRRFRKTLDIYPDIRPDIMCDCSIVVARVFKERRYDPGKGTMMTSYLFDLFVYSVLGATSRYFKDKKKYIAVDPGVINDVCSGTMSEHSIRRPLNNKSDRDVRK